MQAWKERKLTVWTLETMILSEQDAMGASGLTMTRNLKHHSQYQDGDNKGSVQKTKKVKALPVVAEGRGQPLRRTGM
jgi:hypothetical protein